MYSPEIKLQIDEVLSELLFDMISSGWGDEGKERRRRGRGRERVGGIKEKEGGKREDGVQREEEGRKRMWEKEKGGNKS